MLIHFNLNLNMHMWLVVTRMDSTAPKAQNSLPIPRGANGQTRQMFAMLRSNPKTARERGQSMEELQACLSNAP